MEACLKEGLVSYVAPVGQGTCLPSMIPNKQGKPIPPKLYAQVQAKDAAARAGRPTLVR